MLYGVQSREPERLKEGWMVELQSRDRGVALLGYLSDGAL